MKLVKISAYTVHDIVHVYSFVHTQCVHCAGSNKIKYYSSAYCFLIEASGGRGLVR